jgi:fructose 1,6-bisphosphatase
MQFAIVPLPDLKMAIGFSIKYLMKKVWHCRFFKPEQLSMCSVERLMVLAGPNVGKGSQLQALILIVSK